MHMLINMPHLFCLVTATPQPFQPNNNIQQNNTHTHETHIM